MTADPLEHHAARFIAAAVEGLAPESATLVFSSPLCTRSPDLDLMWNRGLRETEPEAITASLRRVLLREVLKGVARLLLEPRRYRCQEFGVAHDRLLVAPAMAGRIEGGRFTTPYLPTGPDDAVFVFGEADRFDTATPLVPRLRITDKVATLRGLLAAGRRGAKACGADSRQTSWLRMRWLSWALGGVWLRDLHLLRLLESRLGRIPVKHVGCVHEMHSYSRVVWRVAQAHGASRHALQHAAITEGKRWYFCEPEELAAGLALPDVMHVFNAHVAGMLKQSWGAGSFPLGCSARYAFWNDALVAPAASAGLSGSDTVLFAGALVRFDNDIVIAAARRLVQEGPHPAVRFRLHPLADVSRDDRKWIAAAERLGEIEVSRGVALAEDIAAAAVVVGMGTTVLEEALLVGRPVIRLSDERYVKYVDVDGITGATSVPASRFTRDDVGRAMGVPVDSEAVRASLGLDHPTVGYGELFS